MQGEQEIWDRQIRSILQDAEAPVAEGVWEAVSASLAPARVRRFPLWTVLSGSVAAAALLAAVLWLPRKTGPLETATAAAEGVSVVRQEAVSPAESEQIGPPTTFGLLASAEPQRIVRRKQFETPAETAPRSTEDTPTPDKQATASTVEAPQTEVGADPRPQHEADFFQDLTGSGTAASKRSPQRKLSLKLGTDASYGGQVAPYVPPRRAPGLLPEGKTLTEAGGDASYALPLTFSIGVRYRLSKRISLGSGLQYTRLSRRFNGKYTEVENGLLIRSASGEITNSQQYLGIPLQLYLDLVRSGKLSSYVFGGGSIERCLQNRFDIPGGSGEHIRYRTDAKGLQVSAAAGLGIQYEFLPHFAFFAEPDVRYYFDCNQPKSIRTQQPLQLSLNLGLRWDIR